MCPIVAHEVLYFEFESLVEKYSCEDWTITELTVKMLIFLYRLMPRLNGEKNCKSFISHSGKKFLYGHRTAKVSFLIIMFTQRFGNTSSTGYKHLSV